MASPEDRYDPITLPVGRALLYVALYTGFIIGVVVLWWVILAH
jgi:hypothetical protein